MYIEKEDLINGPDAEIAMDLLCMQDDIKQGVIKAYMIPIDKAIGFACADC